MSRREQIKSAGSKPKLQLRMTPTKQGPYGAKLKARKSIKISKKTKRKAASVSDVESTSSGGVSLDDDFDADSEDADEESDEAIEPDVTTPSRFTRLRGGTGPKYDEDSDNLSDDDLWDGFPEPDLDLPEIIGHEAAAVNGNSQSLQVADNVNTFLSDDDEMYEGVNQISESESENDATIERRETSMIIRELSPFMFDTDMTSHFANQIDGMSAYGFGSDSEASIGLFTESDDLFEAASRHIQVRFEEPQPLGMEDRMQALIDSPTMTRALLPSALPVTAVRNSITCAEEGDEDDEDYDTDATEELADPETAWRIPRDKEQEHVQDMPDPAPTTPPTMKRSLGLKLPVLGTFIDDGAKPSAILDSTGTKLIISDPHLLGGVFARRYGPSAPASPSVGFAEAVFGSESSHASGSEEPRPRSQPLPDAMHFETTENPHGEASTPAANVLQTSPTIAPVRSMTQDSSLNVFLSRDIFDDDPDSDPETHLNFEDMIVSGNASDSEAIDSTQTPFRQQTQFNATRSMPGSPLSHLHNVPVTAFRQHAQLRHFPDAPEVVPLRNALTTPLKRKRRNQRHDSPYKDPHYKGVTPVQRISYAEHAELSSSPVSAYRYPSMGHKRRKTIL